MEMKAIHGKPASSVILIPGTYRVRCGHFCRRQGNHRTRDAKLRKAKQQGLRLGVVPR